MSEKRRGRPTAAERIKIKKTLQLYYLHDVDLKTTAELADKNKKTVKKYFDGWDEEIKNSSDKSFLEKVKERRQKAIMRFNYQISKLDEMSSILEEKMKQNGGPVTKEFVLHMRLWQENEKMLLH